MERKLVVEFTKMNGAGNDFIVIDNRFYNFTDEELSDLARRFCPRRIGVGADGILTFSRPLDQANHFRMRYVNADGSLGTMCGNGARCLVRFARMAGIEDETMMFETDAGVFRAVVPADSNEPVSLFVGPPRRWSPRYPLEGQHPVDVHYIWTGTEHVVCFVDDVTAAPVERWGPAIRRDAALAPAGANVNFVEVGQRGDGERPAELHVRTYEKGVEAETPACGTGALASAIAAGLLGHIEGTVVRVNMPGGTLGVGYRLNGETVDDVYLQGPAVVVYRGTLEV